MRLEGKAESDGVAPKLTREKGWHHATVSWLSKPVFISRVYIILRLYTVFILSISCRLFGADGTPILPACQLTHNHPQHTVDCKSTVTILATVYFKALGVALRPRDRRYTRASSCRIRADEQTKRHDSSVSLYKFSSGVKVASHGCA